MGRSKTSSCDVAYMTANRKHFLTMHECGEKENPRLTPTQCSMQFIKMLKAALRLTQARYRTVCVPAVLGQFKNIARCRS